MGMSSQLRSCYIPEQRLKIGPLFYGLFFEPFSGSKALVPSLGQMFIKISIGFSKASFTATKNPTDSSIDDAMVNSGPHT